MTVKIFIKRVDLGGNLLCFAKRMEDSDLSDGDKLLIACQMPSNLQSIPLELLENADVVAFEGERIALNENQPNPTEALIHDINRFMTKTLESSWVCVSRGDRWPTLAELEVMV